MERGQAYLLSSERVQELPCRYGRQARLVNSNGVNGSFDVVETIRRFGFEPRFGPLQLQKTAVPSFQMCIQALRTRYRPSLAERCGIVSSRGLNTSLPRCVHPDSIKLVFYKYPKRSLFRCGFGLRCFQPLSASA